ncbi:MAG TPA: class I SAM-dependent methyltransferase [Candidatus Sulfotelmatobacter sp.]|jgi:SAM-dependent methyltransferase
MRDLHLLAGRGPYKGITEFVNRRIFNELGFGSEDRFVDIGCGHGLLLQLAIESGIKTAIGLNATEEEVRPLLALGLDVRVGRTDLIPLPDCSASVVVCNSVLLLVPEDKMAKSLREIARVCEPGARVWLGEIPRIPEITSVPRHESIPEMLWWILRKRGIRSFVGMCRRLLTGDQRGPVLVNDWAAIFFAAPETFIKMAEQAGLRVERHFPHQSLDQGGRQYSSATRHDYLFRRE